MANRYGYVQQPWLPVTWASNRFASLLPNQTPTEQFCGCSLAVSVEFPFLSSWWWSFISLPFEWFCMCVHDRWNSFTQGHGWLAWVKQWSDRGMTRRGENAHEQNNLDYMYPTANNTNIKKKSLCLFQLISWLSCSLCYLKNWLPSRVMTRLHGRGKLELSLGCVGTCIHETLLTAQDTTILIAFMRWSLTNRLKLCTAKWLIKIYCPTCKQ